MKTSALRSQAGGRFQAMENLQVRNTGSVPDMHARARRAKLVESCLEGGFLPKSGELASFLINALYLFGDNAIAAHGGAPDGVATALTRLGHTGFARSFRTRIESRAAIDRQKEGWTPGRPKNGGFDRAVMLNRALGRGEDAEILEVLRGLRGSVRSGGLICFTSSTAIAHGDWPEIASWNGIG